MGRRSRRTFCEGRRTDAVDAEVLAVDEVRCGLRVGLVLCIALVLLGEAAGENLLIQIDHVARQSLGDLLTLVQQNDAVAVLHDGAEVVRDHEDGRAVPSELIHAVIALRLEEDVADGQGLVDDENLRIHRDVEREGEADEHTGGVALDRLVHEITDVREVENLLELLVHLLLREAHHRAVHVDVLDAGIVRVEAGTELEKRTDDAVDADCAF